MALLMNRILFKLSSLSIVKKPQQYAAEAILVALLLLGLSFRLLVISGDLEHLIGWVPDDAFYYFQTARNIVAGHGSTFDGIHEANGFHPLWMFLILPLAANSLDSSLFLRTALALSISFNLLAALLLNALLQRITKRKWVSLAGTALYFLNPQAMISSLNGLETSVSSLVFVICLVAVLSKRPSGDSRRPSGVGVLLALLLLARTDNIFFLAALFFAAIYQADRRSRLHDGLILGLSVALLTSPWFLWNWLKFGSIVQTSADAIPFMFHQNFLQAGHTALDMMGRGAITFLGFLLLFLPEFLGLPPILYQATILYSLLVLAKRRAETADNQPIQSAVPVVFPLWAGAVLLVFTHTFVRWFPRQWYFNQLIILSIITVCLAFALASPKMKWSSIRGLRFEKLFKDRLGRQMEINFAVVASITCIALGEIWMFYRVPYAHQIEMLDAAKWLETNLGQDEIASSFNAGIMGFFSNRRVVNLDGVMNVAAETAIEQRTLSHLMRTSGVDYYLDYDPIMLQTYSPYLGLDQEPMPMVLLQVIDEPGVDPGVGDVGTSIKAYRLDWPLIQK